MDIVRSIARWFLAVAISVTLSMWILAAALTATVANREVVKQWLTSSGVYQNALGSVLQISAPTGGAEDQIVSSDLLQQALAATFDANFIQKGTNTALDATFDWLEGKKEHITFSIPIQEKANEFRTHLATLVQPKLEALPQCTGRLSTTDPNKITCLPPGVSAQTYAQQLTQPSDETNFLNAPLTQESFKQTVPQFAGLPAVVQGMHMLVWALPVTIVLLSGLYVLASPNKIRGGIQVSRRLTIGAAITLAGGLFIMFAAPAVDISSSADPGDQQQMAIINTVLNPLARTVVPDFGRALALYSGTVVAIAGIAWLALFLWHRRRRQSPKPTIQLPPASPHEAQLPPPTAKPTPPPKIPPRI